MSVGWILLLNTLEVNTKTSISLSKVPALSTTFNGLTRELVGWFNNPNTSSSPSSTSTSSSSVVELKLVSCNC
ncbi:hypothetical protein WICPIJ_003749 [Wickerhamomyces pijperi]|uniref:Uncharacterized protein n=1 Tax=Wickerhamomyces pijperi TaxID=599730 RepID=A0A9P8Q909_WICPI|nr:hypothetical protein WICPIJ_003749 [Wickerhamomyces pijperi]